MATPQPSKESSKDKKLCRPSYLFRFTFKDSIPFNDYSVVFTLITLLQHLFKFALCFKIQHISTEFERTNDIEPGSYPGSLN